MHYYYTIERIENITKVERSEEEKKIRHIFFFYKSRSGVNHVAYEMCDYAQMC